MLSWLTQIISIAPAVTVPWALSKPGASGLPLPLRSSHSKDKESSLILQAALSSFLLSAQVLQEVELTQLAWSLVTPCCSSLSRSATTVLVRAAVRQIRDQRQKKRGDAPTRLPVSSVSSVLGAPGQAVQPKERFRRRWECFKLWGGFTLRSSWSQAAARNIFISREPRVLLTFKSLNSISNKPDVLVC